MSAIAPSREVLSTTHQSDTVTDVLDGVLMNLLAQAIWELALSPALRGLGNWLLGGNAGKNQALYQASVDRAFATIERLADDAELSSDEVSRFLEQAEVRTLVKSLYLFRLSDDRERGLPESAEEFEALWTRYGLSSPEIAGGVFDALVTATDETLQTSIEEGVLSAHEAKSAARHRLTTEHLEAMQRTLRLISDSEPISPRDATAFANLLTAEVGSRNAHMSPPDMFSMPRVEIDKLYVLPHLTTRTNADAQDPETLTVDAWLDRLHRAVLLGNPGAGKSTLSKKLCHLLATVSGSPGVAGRPYAPFLIVLRDFAPRKKEKGLSIRAYMEELATANFQLDVPRAAFEYLLLSGRLMVIFDGLDELLETARRQEIRDDVESFCRRYPDVPVVVTSRVVGYEQAPLDPEMFDTLLLSELAEEQISEYAAKWFALDNDLGTDEQARKAEAFVEESRAVPDLRVNPLLLALMCNFYRGQNYLPRHLPDVYENCARMLFEVWDRSRGIEPVLPIAEHIRPAMRSLAYWIYGDEGLESGVTESALVDRAAEFLLDWRFDDPHEARHAAEAFIQFCRGRAWVFTDTGSTGAGEALFQFTHQTFLEYFAADYLVSTVRDTSDLRNTLLDHIAQREWDVVAQIAYQLRGRRALGAADELLEGLLDDARTGDAISSRALNLLSFATRCLAFMVPRPGTARRVAETAVRFAVEGSSRRVDAWPPLGTARGEDTALSLDELVGAVLRAGPEHLQAVVEATRDVLTKLIVDDDGLGAPASVLASDLIQAGRLAAAGPITAEAFVEWEKATGEILEATKDRRVSLAREHPQLATMLAGTGELSIGALVDSHGPGSLFTIRPLPLLPSSYFSSIANTLVSRASVAHRLDRDGVAIARGQLEEVAAVFIALPRPWFTFDAALDPFGAGTLGAYAERPDEGVEPLTATQLFGLVCVLAPAIERLGYEHGGRGREDPEGALPETRFAQLGSIAPILYATLGSDDSVEQETAFNGVAFSSEQQAFLRAWSAREFDLVTFETVADPT
jgi:energy-coupling factor transporter ATP-binding protein EcfA2